VVIELNNLLYLFIFIEIVDISIDGPCVLLEEKLAEDLYENEANWDKNTEPVTSDLNIWTIANIECKKVSHTSKAHEIKIKSIVLLVWALRLMFLMFLLRP